MKKWIKLMACAAMIVSIAILAACPEPAESEAAEEIGDMHFLITEEYQGMAAAADELSKITLDAIREYAERMEQADLERFLQMQPEQYLEPAAIPEGFGNVPDMTGADTEGFLPYEIPEEYVREDGLLPEEVQVWAYAQCRKAMVDYPTLLAIIEKESRYHYDAKGDGSCIGYMQIIPKWHKERMERLGITNIADPYQNITVGVDIMAELLEMYGGNYAKALTAYNCGPEGAKKVFVSGKEANGYARKVMRRASEIGEGFVNAAENR